MLKVFSLTINVVLLILTLVSFVTTAKESAPTLFVDGQLEQIDLTFYTQRYLDDSAQLSFSAIQQNEFEPILTPEKLHLGYFDGALWLRSVITNTSNEPLLKILSYDYANLDDVALYIIDAHGKVTQRLSSGTHMKRSERPIKNRHASFPVTIPAQATVSLYSRIQTNGSLTAYQHLYSASRYDETYSNELFWLSIYCGMLVALGLYNLLLFTALRQSVFFRYALFVGSFLFGTLAMNGLGAQFFWDHATLNVNRVMAFSFSAAGFTATLFVRTFLSLKQHSTLWYRITLLPLAVSAIGMLGALFASPQTALQLSDVNGLTAGLVLLSCGIACLIKRIPGAKLFVIAWSLLLSGAFIHALRNLGVMPTNFVSLYGMQIGSAIEMLLLSFAIAAKFNQLKLEKQRAQDEMLTRLKTNQAKLAQTLELRTDELQQMATRDGLTGLLNRTGLNQTLAASIKRCQRNKTMITLLMLDLDAFKAINDVHGYDIGDSVLKQVANRLQQCTQGYDTVARFGDKTFIIVCESLQDQTAAELYMEGVREHLSKPLQFNARVKQLALSTSVNFYQIDADKTSVNSLLKDADKALSRLKYQQRGKRLRQ